MKTEEMPMHKREEQLDLDFESSEEKRARLIRSIQNKKFVTFKELTPEEEELDHILSATEKEDDQYYHKN